MNKLFLTPLVSSAPDERYHAPMHHTNNPHKHLNDAQALQQTPSITNGLLPGGAGPALGQGERGGRSRPSMPKGPSSRALDVVEL